jgi:hypothetical protein
MLSWIFPKGVARMGMEEDKGLKVNLPAEGRLLKMLRKIYDGQACLPKVWPAYRRYGLPAGGRLIG